MGWTTVALVALSAGLASANLPVVDLGYELHQASYFNTTGNFYNFSNIRYAAPPVGNLRFAAPQAPATDRSSVQDGSQGRVCPQAFTAWEAITGQFLAEYLAGKPVQINTSSAGGGGGGTFQLDPRTTEDCLFLDVVVPDQIFEQAGQSNCTGAPVLVWIYGGGYVGGDKAGSFAGYASGLIKRSNENIVFVALNYRLGAMGWLSGPTFQADGVANAGLHDQRFALEWIQDNIAKFGGDPNRVTVMGESAGGGSIMHQITAYGGNRGPVPFQQAIPQSPGWLPITSNLAQENTFESFLSYLNVTTLEEARNASSVDVITANLKQIAASPYGSFTYGPAVDGDFVPQLPGLLLLHDQFDSNVTVMVGHNADEGLLFTSPFVTNDSTIRTDLQSVFPDITPAVLNYIDNLYPQSAFPDVTSKIAKISSELAFECNTFYFDKAYKNETYSYFFTVPPALHGEDVVYTFYDDTGAVNETVALGGGGVQNVTVALALQDWIVTFTQNGVPSAPDFPSGAVPKFTTYGPDAQVENLGVKGFDLQTDDAANARCNFWQKALYA